MASEEPALEIGNEDPWSSRKKKAKKPRKSIWDDFDAPTVAHDTPVVAHEKTNPSLVKGFDPSSTIVALKVGEPETCYYVHRNVLCKSSSFMRTKSKPEWNNTESSSSAAPPSLPEIILKHEKPEVVQTYINWLYSSTLPEYFKPGIYYDDIRPDIPPIFCDLAALFVFGEYIGDSAFQNTVIDAIGSLFSQNGRGQYLFPVGAKVVNTIYGGTTSGSPARRFLVDIYFSHASETAFLANGSSADEADMFPSHFILDLTRSFLRNRNPSDTGYFRGSSGYHISPDNA